MVNYGLISEQVEFIHGYKDKDVTPMSYVEFEAAMRFFHTFVADRIK